MTHVKICGLTRPEDVDAAVDAGVHFVGFNLWRGSKRTVRPHAAAALVQRLPATVIPVGVFVHGEPEDLVCAQVARVAWVQITSTPRGWTSGRIARPVIRGIAADHRLVPDDLSGADWFILDTPQAGHGGGGAAFDWSLADGVAGHDRLFVAGGLTPDNVGEVVRRLRPYAVDVASGVESAPGKKDHGKMRAFVAAVRAADAGAKGMR